MMTYDELKTALKDSKIDVQKNIVALLIQTEQHLTSSEIAEMVGANPHSVAGLIRYGDVRKYAKELGYEIETEKKPITKIFVNIDNPNEQIRITKNKLFYSASHRGYWSDR